MSIELKLTGHLKDLGGGFTVKRLLPSAQRQSVGPFLFFDHFGPITVQPGESHDVRPHPHIGLATVTYLFEGAIMHRDSIGSVQRIEPGAINWMTAGRGIVHSERGPEDLKAAPYVNHGIQLWAALPREYEEVEPAFAHTPAADIPLVHVDGVEVRVLAGHAFGKISPVKSLAPAIYLDVRLLHGTKFVLPSIAPELAIYSIDFDIDVDGELLPAHTLALLKPEGHSTITAPGGAHLMVLGGDALDGKRLMWWNFISSRRERIVQAAEDWAAQRMGRVAGDGELIPLPDTKLQPIR